MKPQRRPKPARDITHWFESDGGVDFGAGGNGVGRPTEPREGVGRRLPEFHEWSRAPAGECNGLDPDTPDTEMMARESEPPKESPASSTWSFVAGAFDL